MFARPAGGDNRLGVELRSLEDADATASRYVPCVRLRRYRDPSLAESPVAFMVEESEAAVAAASLWP